MDSPHILFVPYYLGRSVCVRIIDSVQLVYLFEEVQLTLCRLLLD